MSGCGKCGGTGMGCKENLFLLFNVVACLGGALLKLGPYMWSKVNSSFNAAAVFVENVYTAKMSSHCPQFKPLLPSFSNGMVIGAVGTAVSIGFYYGQKYYSDYVGTPPYLPFAGNYEEAAQKGASAIGVRTHDNIIEGDGSQANLVQALKASHIWMKGGLNFVELKEGGNSLYFSLCSTKILSGMVSVVKGFTNSDKIYFFCSKSPNIDKTKDIVLYHNVTYNEQEFTCVEAKGKNGLSPVCFLEAGDLSMSNIEITTIEEVRSIFEL